jgi:hypothetical protein
MAVGAVIVAPAVLLALYRAQSDETDDLSTWWGGPVKLFLCSLAVFIFLMVRGWSDQRNIGFMVGEAAGVTFIVAAHVCVVLFLTKLLQVWIKPKQRRVASIQYGALFVASTAFFVWSKESDHFTRLQQEAAAPARSQQASPAPRRDPAYDQTLATLEARYPQLNPDSPMYSQAVADRVIARMDVLTRNGLRPADALVRAVDELIAQQPPAHRAPTPPVVVHTPQPAPVAPRSAGTSRALPIDCVFKPVMTDADYRACGISPPR